MPKRFSIRAFLCTFALLAVALAVFRVPLIALFEGNLEPWKLCTTQRDLEAAMGDRMAVMLVHADWSVTSALTKRNAKEFIASRRWKKRHPELNFYLLDITHAPPNWLVKWAEADAKLNGVQHAGDGSLTWIQEGKTLLRSANLRPSADLNTLANDAFQTKSN